ncbi:hypothetical protein C8J57DRAFT_1364683 [Mycena rebaudengoi]|nr:hypothetical protein C8J57DRAFT_1364683 [Mycena rebaudengoi]
MTDSKSPAAPTTSVAGPSMRRTVSIDTLPQYSSEEENRRRSLEDASTPLPEGWFCHLDPYSNHHFYVDMNTTPPRSVWQHPRHGIIGEVAPPSPTGRASTEIPKRPGLLAKLKEKMIYSQADRAAERAEEGGPEQGLFTLTSNPGITRAVLDELQKNGGKTRFAGSEYVGPPASPYGGTYRALMPPAPSRNQDLAGWL